MLIHPDSSTRRPQRVLHGILASRLIINLRKAATGTEARITTVTTMSFPDVLSESKDSASGLFSGSRALEDM